MSVNKNRSTAKPTAPTLKKRADDAIDSARERAITAYDNARDGAAAAEDELTTILIGLWDEHLDGEEVTAHTNFFASGGQTPSGRNITTSSRHTP